MYPPLDRLGHQPELEWMCPSAALQLCRER